ncbi:alcohol acetyltransferase-domain-containing protein [Chaetomium sp. MPI-SDFR-AT-0129]|nr:alcohol acetyltransferase-domain-containing protein [Chaetomium sp. MPI-SDFR-AT-0129]
MNAGADIVRPLGPTEIYSSSRHALGFYNCVANTCRYSVSVAGLQGQSVQDALQTALAKVVLAIPSLGVGIVGQETSKPQFVQQAAINLEHHFEFWERAETDSNARDTVLLRFLEERHDQSWPDIAHRPPWKLTAIVWNEALEDGDGNMVIDAILAIHHSLADGRSTALFHTHLLEELNCAPKQVTHLTDGILNLKASGVRMNCAPQEDVVNFTKSWMYLAQTLWHELGPAWLKGNPPAAPWTGKPVTSEPRQTGLRLIRIPAAAVPRILAACRANHTTLTPLLHALILASLSRHISPKEVVEFRSTTPIDLRPFAHGGEHESGNRDTKFGVFVTAQDHSFDNATIAALREQPLTKRIWQVAAGLRRDIKQRVAELPRDDIMSMLGWVSDWREFWLSKVGTPRKTTWEVSNIGAMLGGTKPEGSAGARSWMIQRSLMSQGCTVAGAAVSASVSGVVGGEVDIVLGWQLGIIETALVDALVVDLQRWIDQASQGQDFV